MAALKEVGNKLFLAGDFEAAVVKYSEAIQMEPENAIFYLNRCMAKYKLQRYRESLDDATKACALDSSWVKAHIRKSQVLRALKRAPEAVAYLKALANRFSTNEGFRDELDLGEAMLEKARIEKEFKGNVVDFAVKKSQGESDLKNGMYKEAAKKYDQQISLMEQMLSQLPAGQGDDIKKKLDQVRLKMKGELKSKHKEQKKKRDKIGQL